MTAKATIELPDPQNPRALRDALGRFATGVALVTAVSPVDGMPLGIVVNSFASVSLDPPLVLWSVAKSSNRHDLFAATPGFAIHVLRADQTDLVGRFGRSGPGFEGLPTASNPERLPVLTDCLARFDCALESAIEAGDHTILLGRVLRFAVTRPEQPLCFYAGGFVTVAAPE